MPRAHVAMFGSSGPPVPIAQTAPTYIGQFATACGRIPSAAFSANTKGMSRSRHIARSSVTSLQVAFPNFLVAGTNLGDGFTETGPGATATVTAAIEYNGSTTQVTWSASPSTTIADGAISALSDAVSVSIPEGAAFFVRCFFQCANGVIGNYGIANGAGVAGIDTANGESWRVGSSATDETLNTGTIVNGADVTGFMYVPTLLVAPITKSSMLLIGDSRIQGFRDVFTGTSGDRGQLSRAVGALYGYTETGVPGEAASAFISSHAIRASLKTYFTHVITDHGINDEVHEGASAATVAGRLTTIAGYFAGLRVYQATITPFTTSSDSWATLGNQTPESHNGARVSLNGLIRAGISGFTGYLEVADIAESSRDSGKWLTNGSANTYTDDGIHETNTMNILIKDTLVLP